MTGERRRPVEGGFSTVHDVKRQCLSVQNGKLRCAPRAANKHCSTCKYGFNYSSAGTLSYRKHKLPLFLLENSDWPTLTFSIERRSPRELRRRRCDAMRVAKHALVNAARKCAILAEQINGENAGCVEHADPRNLLALRSCSPSSAGGN